MSNTQKLCTSILYILNITVLPWVEACKSVLIHIDESETQETKNNPVMSFIKENSILTDISQKKYTHSFLKSVISFVLSLIRQKICSGTFDEYI